MDFENVEKIVQGFVSLKVAEDVSVDLNETCVTVKHVTKSGSTVLAMLWVKVFQHPGNFPASAYTYRRHKNDDNTESLSIHIHDAVVSVNLLTGSLAIKGQYAQDWFKTRFLNVVWAYESNVDEPKNMLPYPKDVPHKAKYNSHLRKESPRREDASPETGVTGEDDEEVIVAVADDDDAAAAVVVEEEDDEPVAVIPDKCAVNGAATSELFVDSILDRHIQSARKGLVADGASHVYVLWKSLIHRWFAEGRKVYIVSPQLDKQRLLDVINLLLDNKNTAQLQSVHTGRRCDGRMTLAQIKEAALREYTPRKQLVIEYRVFAKLRYQTRQFGCKFIAGVTEDNEADVLVTSAAFSEASFGVDAASVESVLFTGMTARRFDRQFLSKLGD